MASVGPNYATAGASLANAGTSEDANAWVNPGNVGSAATTTTITAATFDSPDISEILVASGFGFSLGTSDIITGITVEIRKRGYTSANSGADNRVQLSTTTAFSGLVGANKAAAGVWPQTTLTTTTYGGTTDNWTAGLTPAQVNDAGFSVFLSAAANVANADIEVDWIRVTLTYTAVATVESSFTANAVVKRTIATETFTADAIRRRSSGTLTSSADALRLRGSGTQTLTADAVILRSQLPTATADAVVYRAMPGSATADAIVRRQATGTLAADAIRRVAVLPTFSAAAVIKQSMSGSGTADAIRLRTFWFGSSEAGF